MIDFLSEFSVKYVAARCKTKNFCKLTVKVTLVDQSSSNHEEPVLNMVVDIYNSSHLQVLLYHLLRTLDFSMFSIMQLSFMTGGASCCELLFLQILDMDSHHCYCLSQWVYWTNLLEIECIFSTHQEIATN